MILRSALAVVCGIVWCGIGSAYAAESASTDEQALTEKRFNVGRDLYRAQCAVCHGQTGAGDGRAAYLLYPKPRDLTKNEFRLISTKDMQATDQDLFRTITRGMPGSSMPGWGHLTEEERWGLVYYVRYLSRVGELVQSGEATESSVAEGLSWPLVEKVVRTRTDPESLIGVTVEPAVTDECLGLGRELFVKACASCHGNSGKGDGQQAMSDSSGLPLRPRDLTAGIFKGSSDSRDLYHRIAAGLPGSPMPGYLEALSDEEIWNLVHYVQTLSDPEAEKLSLVRRTRLDVRTVDRAPEEPLDVLWQQQEPTHIALTPLWWRDDRVQGIMVRVLRDEHRIAFHLSWKDASQNDTATAIQAFSDGVAIQLSDSDRLPTFAMGAADAPVTIWSWKAAWQQDLERREDIETVYPNASIDWYSAQKNYKPGDPVEMADTQTRFHDPMFITGWGAGNSLSDPHRRRAVEESMAKGLSTLTTQRVTEGAVDVKGEWKDGVWSVVFVRDLAARGKGRVDLRKGDRLSVAFAVWDGSKRDRNGQKAVSIWNELVIGD
ncbi:MAG: hypothetical protein MOGMAGMI_02131 [Candidatus Omnitrophica bacterium]|nr:hypothetical protein [Candidatus Omnitrophota bacterium]